MVKMVSLKKTATERKAEQSASGQDVQPYVPAEDQGLTVNLEHHHLTKLGVDGGLKSGDNVQLHGAGTVERSETRSTPDGERHSATLRLHHGAIDHDPAEREEYARKDVRGDLEKAYK